MNQPRTSPKPCSPTCVGWAVFETHRCTVHGPECNADGETCYTLEVQACDECWSGVADAPDDAYFRAAPMCQEALRAALVEHAADVAEGRDSLVGKASQRDEEDADDEPQGPLNSPKVEEWERDAARDILEALDYLVLPPAPADVDEEEIARVVAYLRRGGYLPATTHIEVE